MTIQTTTYLKNRIIGISYKHDSTEVQIGTFDQHSIDQLIFEAEENVELLKRAKERLTTAST